MEQMNNIDTDKISNLKGTLGNLIGTINGFRSINTRDMKDAVDKIESAS
jgi:hypothetical protein